MAIRDWLRPPRQVLVVFLAVAIVSTGALGWLAWRVLRQDAELEIQRQRVALEQAADAAVGAMQQSLASLITLAAQPPHTAANIPADVSIVTIEEGRAAIGPARSLPYLPVTEPFPEPPSSVFEAGHEAEFRLRDFARASRVYSELSTNADPVVRAGALGRLARVRRRLADVDGALAAYEVLDSMPPRVSALGYPASLLAALGRLSALEEAQRLEEARAAAERLLTDLAQGRWALLQHEYTANVIAARKHLGEHRAAAPPDALARAAALGWLWQRRSSLPPVSSSLVHTASGTALAVWQLSAGRLQAAVAGPVFVSALCANAKKDGLDCAISDNEGRAVAGTVPAGLPSAIRSAVTSELPWTVHVSFPEGAAASTPRTRLPLLSLLVGLAVVLGAGWYFIVRAVSREIRIARLQTDFVAAVSHEFRSPLTSLAHVSEMLAGDRIHDEDVKRQSYGVLVRDTDRLRRMVEMLLDFGRFEAGATLRLEAIDVGALVRETAEEFQAHVSADGYTIDANVPAEPMPLAADRECLSRAVWNLLDNAVKYSPDARTVWIEAASTPQAIAIRVSDRGLGVPAHEQREIFNRFVRGAESKARRIRGTGVGLALVQQIVHAHGGDVSVRSDVGIGSTFEISLPVPADGASARSERAPQTSSAVPRDPEVSSP
jgi:signal transduction histidine kinase